MKVKDTKVVGVGRAIKTLLLIGAVALAYCSSANAANTITAGAITSISPTNLIEGSNITLVATFVDSAQPTNDGAIVIWGDGVTNTWGAVTNGSTTNVTITATHAYVNASDAGYNISVQGTNNNTSVGATDTTNNNVVADAPLWVVFAGPVTNLTEGVVAPNVTYLSFVDGNLLATNSQYHFVSTGAITGNLFTASNTVAATFTISNAGPSGATGVLFNVIASGRWQEEGSNSVAITVTDFVGAVGSSITATTTVVVADAPLVVVSTGTLVFTEGVVSNETLLTFMDDNTLANAGSITGTLTDYVALVLWGDGTSTLFSNNVVQSGATNDTLFDSGLSIVGLNGANNTNIFSVLGEHGYPSNGTYYVTVTVNDVGGAPAIVVSSNSDVVGDAGLTLVNFNSAFLKLSGFESLEQFNGNNPTGAVLITFIDTNEFSSVPPIEFTPFTEYLATITWGDGSNSVGTIIPAGTNYTYITASGVHETVPEFQVWGNHTYSSICTNYNMSVLVQDVGSTAQLNAMTVFSVVNAQITPTAYTIYSSNNTFSGIVAAFADTDSALTAGSFTVTIDWGDHTIPTVGSIVTTGNGYYYVQGTHTYSGTGSGNTPEHVTVTVTDNSVCGLPVAISSTIYFVAGIGIVQPLTSTTVYTGVPFCTNVATFTDTSLPAALSNDLSAVIVWDDDTASAGTITKNAAGQYVVTGCHTYSTDGYYDIQVNIVDSADNLVATAYDEGAGYFVSEPQVQDVTSEVEVLFGDLKIVPSKTPISVVIVQGEGTVTNEVNYYSYYQVPVTLENISTSKTPIQGPFGLEIDYDEGIVCLLNITGVLPDGRQYIPLNADVLKPKQKIKATITYVVGAKKGPILPTIRVLAGPGL